ncbi:zinc-ribbon and DUF3426 domain-containing protein [Hydrogenophilus thiooxidans]|uniref:zinc-ribbon and DUF3426 domain-containing protein n=1 Tax=Hydrogenophilus thiooxidans TaxID=2820326 RepID=UPI001C215A9E|nr:zinc-ribbon and DUF3426 domain-containing protein [Hydrogenophilus thiooxidans]
MSAADDRPLREERVSAKRIVRCPHCGATFATSDRVLAKAQGWALCGECFEPFDALRATVLQQPPEVPPATHSAQNEPQPHDVANESASSPLRSKDEPPAPSPFAVAPAAFSDTAALSKPHEAQNLFARAVVLLLASLLLLTALAQAAWLAHTPLIRYFPELYAKGTALCRTLGCTLTPPADPERLQIDAARLIKEAEPGRYTLELTLTNRAAYPMPWPHLAITLTDGLGRALVRKNLAPAEWRAPQQSPFAPQRRIAVTLSLQIVESGIVGFEVVPFYP